MPPDDWPVRVVVDTDALIDDPDLAICATVLGARYMAHLLQVVLRELDDLKRSGRSQERRKRRTVPTSASKVCG